MGVEADYKIVSHASFGNSPESWQTIAESVVRIAHSYEMAEKGWAKLDLQTSLDFHKEVVAKVEAHPDELSVYHWRNDEFLLFSALIPDATAPFDVVGNGVGVGYHLVPSFRKKELSPNQSMPAARDINFLNGRDRPVWMGAGVDRSELHVDSCVPRDGSQPKKLAIGSQEVAALFTELYSDETIKKPDLFGALFHVALLASEFEVEIPAVPAFTEQSRAAQTVVLAKMALSNTVIESDSRTIDALKMAQSDFCSSRIAIDIDDKGVAVHDPGVRLPYMGDQRSWPYIDLRDYDHEIGILSGTISALDKERAEHGRRIGHFGKWLEICQALAG